VDEKKYVGKDVLHIAVFKKTEPEQVYNMIYQDGRGGNIMVKRFTVGGTTRDKEYELTKGKEGTKVLWFSLDNPEQTEAVRIFLKPKPKLRITQIDVNFGEVEVKGRGTLGNIVTRNPVQKIQRLTDVKPVAKAEQISIPIPKGKEAGKKEMEKKPVGKAPLLKKAEGKNITKKASPSKAEKAVTMEWNFKKENENVKKDREKILSELEKKTQAKKAQTKLDI
jgi:hypothetical protein